MISPSGDKYQPQKLHDGGDSGRDIGHCRCLQHLFGAVVFFADDEVGLAEAAQRSARRVKLDRKGRHREQHGSGKEDDADIEQDRADLGIEDLADEDQNPTEFGADIGDRQDR